MSTTIADQLKLKQSVLDKPINLQLAILGSRSKVKLQVSSQFEYQGVKEEHTFDVINLESYDIILGTLFLYQHQVQLGFNPYQVNIQSDKSLPIKGEQVLTLESHATEIKLDCINNMCKSLKEYALPICKEAKKTPLPPLCAINHTIPLIDEHKVYLWQLLKCPEQMKPLWCEKRENYIQTGRWCFQSGQNVVPSSC